MPFFYGVQPKNQGLRLFLELLRFVSEPDAVRFPHITLRGPHERKIEKSRLDELNAIVRQNRCVRVLGPGKFFSGSQNTVVLLIDLQDLRRVWYKPTYPDGEAHITIYDGGERGHAYKLLSALEDYDWSMEISIGLLSLLEPKVSENQHGLLRRSSLLYQAYEKFDPSGLPQLDELKELSFSDRLIVLRKILDSSTLPRIPVGALLHA